MIRLLIALIFVAFSSVTLADTVSYVWDASQEREDGTPITGDVSYRLYIDNNDPIDTALLTYSQEDVPSNTTVQASISTVEDGAEGRKSDIIEVTTPPSLPTPPNLSVTVTVTIQINGN